MTDSAKIAVLETMLGEDDAGPEVLSAYLELAAQKILNRMYPYKTDYAGIVVPERYEWIQLNVACYLYNKRGAEGQIQHIENGIHRNYGDADVPDNMMKDITPFAQAIR